MTGEILEKRFRLLQKPSEKGFALLTVLMVVALVSIISAQMLYSQHSQIQRSGFMLHQAQALSVQWGLEDWVKQGLKLDGENSQTDHLQELWAQPLPPVPFADGEVGGVLTDAQSRLNLNNVLSSNESERKLWAAMINRYLERQKVNFSGSLSDLVTDWVDKDETPMSQGAESDRYQLQTPAYSAAGQPMVTVEALQNFPAFQKLKWAQQQTVAKGLVALPGIATINVNTVTSEVLQAVADWMTPQMAEAWIAQRDQKPAESAEEFIQFVEQQTGLTAEEVQRDLPTSMIGVASNFFILQGQLSYGLAKETIIFALFYRDTQNRVGLVHRWFGFAE